MTLPRPLGGRRWRLFLALVLNGFGQAAAVLGSAWLIQQIVDRHFVSGAGSGGLAPTALALLAAALLAAALRAHERVAAERLGQAYVDRLRRRLFRQLMRLAPREHSRRRRGELLLRFVGDLGALRRWLTMGLARLVVAGLLVVATSVVLLLLNPRLAIAVLLPLLAGVAGTLLIGPSLEVAVRESRRRRSWLAANVSEKIAALPAVQALGQRRRETRRAHRQSRALAAAMVHRAKLIGVMRAVSEGATRLAIALALVVGALEVRAGMVSPGDVVAAMSIVAFLAGPLRDLGRVFEYWQAATVSREKISGFLGDPRIIRERRRPATLADGPGRVEFRDVAVTGLFSGVNACAEPGRCTAIVGDNGSGKSTLLWLVARLLDPDAGEILLDGQPIRELALDDLRQAVGVVSPDFGLLRGSIERNLRYRNPRASDAELQRIIELCGVDELLAEIPGGLRARVAEDGRNLSLGQRQRIALARALLGRPRVLLLDEPETGLDATARRALDRVLRTFSGTILLATHDPARIAMADQSWLMRDGRLQLQAPEEQRAAAVILSLGDHRQLAEAKRRGD
ncbi:MAG: ABC transporter ATP-binding protein [Gammaproteobacteria bacterium]|nr:MAG: ABC transporter ATP-binding protein [Gammaproteobacteria bacterium]